MIDNGNITANYLLNITKYIYIYMYFKNERCFIENINPLSENERFNNKTDTGLWKRRLSVSKQKN